MSDHNVNQKFGSTNDEPKTPWYKRKSTYFIGVPVLLAVIIVNGIVGDGKAGREAHKDESPKAAQVTEPVETAEPVEVTPEPEPEPIQVEPAPSTEEMAMIVLRDGWPYFATVPDAMITETSIAVCDALDSGVSFEAYILVAGNSGIPAEEAGALIGYAANVHCPQHLNIADGY